ncbi:MAG: hypothetical protein KOO60_08375 [Gemmatimonadales bacterium]|nr:hypothetical protein [Gemmatimonadales bacterium]
MKANQGIKEIIRESWGFSRTILVPLVAIIALLLIAQVSPAAQTIDFDNGITATIHGHEEITAGLVLNTDGTRDLVHTAVGSQTLMDSNSGWFPFDEEAVVNALSCMQGFSTRMNVDVFVLPAPPAGILSSFARQGAIFLSPGTGPVPEVTVAYITTHEMGHVLTWAFMDDYPSRWESYMALRGLDESNLSSDAIHADRAREILAEDIRFLFGGYLATSSGTIENHDIIKPNQVDGLDQLLIGYFQEGQEDQEELEIQEDIVVQKPIVTRAFPNPCNPLTTIEMALDSRYSGAVDSAVLRIFDIRGSLVRTISSNQVAMDRVTIQWNGSDESGSLVASGRYLYIIQAGSLAAKGSVTLVR